MDYIEKWKAERERKAFLALADGTVFRGVAFGARKDALGEVVFNTGMCGYQEIVTDPSYAGQLVALTAAEVGCYGANGEDVESRGLFLSGLVVNDLTPPSSWRSEMSLDAYLAGKGVPGIRAVDVRALTLHIRDHGSQKAYLHVEEGEMGWEAAVARARGWVGLDGQDYAAKVTCNEPYAFNQTIQQSNNPTIQQSNNPTIKQSNNPTIQQSNNPTIPHIVCYDFGVKANILRSLASWAKVTVVPAKTSAEDVLAMKPDGVFLSNGPADPAAVTYAIDNIRKLLGFGPKAIEQSNNPTIKQSNNQTIQQSNNQTIQQSNNQTIPIMGICLGHQLLSLACGAKTMRLKFGHHGCNHPVKDLATGKVEITSQNHNFAVDPATLPDCLEVTHVNLNDGTIEGVRHRTLPAMSVQYHPESCPGPHDSCYLFNQFKSMIAAAKGTCGIGSAGSLRPL